MNNKNNSLKNILKTLAHKRVQYDKRLIHPEREWLMGLFVFAAIVICGGMVDAFIFIQYQNLDVSPKNIATQSVTYNKAAVQKALEAYSLRTAAYMQLQNNSAGTQVPVEVASSTPIVTDIPTATSTSDQMSTGTIQSN